MRAVFWRGRLRRARGTLRDLLFGRFFAKAPEWCMDVRLPVPAFGPNRSFSRLPSGGLQFRASCFSLARHLLFWPQGRPFAGLILPQQLDKLRIREKLAATFHLPVICFSLARHLLFFIMKT